MKNRLLPALAFSAIVTLFQACSKDEGGNPNQPTDTSFVYPSAIYYVNEGFYNQGNGSIGYYNHNGVSPSTMVHDQDYFKTVNNRSLGDVVQSLTFANGKGYIVVNNSSKVEVVNADDFRSVATITGIASPRYLLANGTTKAFVTDWATNTVKTIDLTTNTVSGSIPAGTGPEKMQLVNNKLYVSNSGGFISDSTLTVIDPVTNTALLTFRVGSMPSGLQTDNNGYLWVLCGGVYPDFNGNPGKAGSLVKVDPQLNQVVLELPFTDNSAHPQNLAKSPNGNFVYYCLNDKVYKMSTTATALPSSPFIQLTGKNLYGINVNPANGDVLVTAAPYTENGKIYIYTEAGVKKGELEAGVFTNSVVFK